jgi:serine/threonine-protein kinase
MLGSFGETMVVDWGLAKATGKHGARDGYAGTLSDLPPLVSSSDSGSQTQAGVALGTPYFMSPEQAAGRVDLLGPATDVYSLGATLYAVLTGKAPLEATPADHPSHGVSQTPLLDRIAQGEFPRPRAVLPSVPRALEAICTKAMALEPKDRYGSARELKADIEHWLADEPVSAWKEPLSVKARRWMRRRRTLVTSAAAVLVVAFLGLGVGNIVLGAKNAEITRQKEIAEANEREARRQEGIAKDNEAEAKRQEGIAKANEAEAKRRRQQARAAVDEFFTKVSDDPLLLKKEPGTQELRRSLLEKAKKFYEEEAKIPGVDASTFHDAGWSYFRLAFITNELTPGFAARTLYERAREIFEKLARENPQVTQYASDLAKTWNSLVVCQF